jgi:hypothetical protein
VSIQAHCLNADHEHMYLYSQRFGFSGQYSSVVNMEQYFRLGWERIGSYEDLNDRILE